MRVRVRVKVGEMEMKIGGGRRTRVQCIGTRVIRQGKTRQGKTR